MTETVAGRIEASGVIAVLRGVEPSSVPDVVRAVVAGGIDIVEITADSPNAASVIEELARGSADVLVGAGTVLDVETVDQVCQAGAKFVVSPTVDAAIIEASNRTDTIVAPGAYTPTEVYRAWRSGADMVKIFPATTGGPSHLAALGGPFGDVPLLPTGGIDATNAAAFIRAGAIAVGVGGALIDHEAIEAGDFASIRENARSLKTKIDRARS